MRKYYIVGYEFNEGNITTLYRSPQFSEALQEYMRLVYNDISKYNGINPNIVIYKTDGEVLFTRHKLQLNEEEAWLKITGSKDL